MNITMKTTASFLLVCLLFCNSTFAQTASYSVAMKKGLEQAKTARTVASLRELSDYFEHIGQDQKTQWLPAYYAALYNMLAGTFSMKTPKDADPMFDKAMVQISQANRINPNESEILALKGHITYMQMVVDPTNRYIISIPQTKAEIDSAQTLNAENPRVYYLRGMQLFYTPEQYGGGKGIAKPILQQALDKYKTFKPENELAPNWGAVQAQTLLDACSK